jgi:RNA polymerase sigma-70 factor (ECF subfamily)
LIDLNLIEKCRKGDLTRFRELVKLTTPFVYPVVFRIMGDGENARDIVQDTMVTIWQKIGKMKSAEAYKTWVCRIAMNKCYDKLRQEKNNPEIMHDDRAWNLIANTVSDGSASLLENEEIAAIIKALTSRLTPKQKTVFVLSELEEMSHDEIEEITGMSKTSIKANLFLARKNISGMIEKYIR